MSQSYPTESREITRLLRELVEMMKAERDERNTITKSLIDAHAALPLERQ